MKFPAFVFAAMAVAVAAPAAAHQYQAGDIVIGHPWSRPAAQGMNGAGYLTLTNTGDRPDVLVAVETEAAAKVEIHESSVEGGVMRMRRIDGGLAVAPGQKVALAPGGKHLMLLKLKRPLAVGDKVPATLVFRDAGRVKVSFTVQAAPPATKPGHAH